MSLCTIIDLTFVKWFCFINRSLTLIIQGMEMIISPAKCVIGYAEAEVRYAGVTGTRFLLSGDPCGECY